MRDYAPPVNSSEFLVVIEKEESPNRLYDVSGTLLFLTPKNMERLGTSIGCHNFIGHVLKTKTPRGRSRGVDWVALGH